jgi:hypothetical protein
MRQHGISESGFGFGCPAQPYRGHNPIHQPRAQGLIRAQFSSGNAPLFAEPHFLKSGSAIDKASERTFHDCPDGLYIGIAPLFNVIQTTPKKFSFFSTGF